MKQLDPDDFSSFILEALRRYWFLLAVWPAVAAGVYFAMATLHPPIYTAILDFSYPSALTDAVQKAVEERPEGVAVDYDDLYRKVLIANSPDANDVAVTMDAALSKVKTTAEFEAGRDPQYASWLTYIRAIQVQISDHYTKAHTIAASMVWTLFGTGWLVLFLNAHRRPRRFRNAPKSQL